MENKTKLTIGSIITLLLAMSGTYYIADGDDAFYCEAKDMVMICEKLSSGIGSRCYFEDTYKICKEGWKPIEIGQEIKPEPIIVYKSVAEGYKWKCPPLKECVRIN